MTNSKDTAAKTIKLYIKLNKDNNIINVKINKSCNQINKIAAIQLFKNYNKSVHYIKAMQCMKIIM